jgi:DNA-binding CsgD family transcriptional regulator
MSISNSKMKQNPFRRHNKKAEELWQVHQKQMEKLKEDLIEQQRDKYRTNYVLSPVQYEIMKLLRSGQNLSQREIGLKVGITQTVVSHHLKQIIKNNPELQDEIKSYDSRTRLKIYRL